MLIEGSDFSRMGGGEVTEIANEDCSTFMGSILSAVIGYTVDESDEKAMQQIRRGFFKRRVRVEFEVNKLAGMYVPQQYALQRIIDKDYQTFLLYQNQANSRLFECYAVRRSNSYCKANELEQVIKEFVHSMVGGSQNGGRLLHYKSTNKVGRQFTDGAVRKQMQTATAYNMARQIVDYYSEETLNGESGDKKGGRGIKTFQIVAQGNRAFDVGEFQRNILKAIENIMFFTQHPIIRALRIESNKAKQRSCLRVLDHRPLIQDIWNDAIKQTLKGTLAQNITQEQISTLFNANYHHVMTIFNSLVLGDTSFIIQPHPVRALLDHLPYLMQVDCFDLSMYNFEGTTLNWLVAAYFIGRNFFTCDDHMVNTQGSICFAGTPGSGKSHIISILYEFVNGFNYQDTPKGMTEFQNYDIVTKSFIKCEEVFTKRLAQPDWKMLADLQVALKCKIKNQQDVEVTKNVPVVITTNDDVFQVIIDRAVRGDQNYQAVQRRWAFVRYFYSWREKHEELFGANGLLKNEYADIYQHVHTNKALMNSLMACTLIFDNSYQVMPPYIMPYYAHCIKQFSLTLMGNFVLRHRSFVVDSCKYLGLEIYPNAPGMAAKAELNQLSKTFEGAFVTHWQQLFTLHGLFHQKTILENEMIPLYQRCVLLGFDQEVIKLLRTSHRLLLVTFFSGVAASNCPLQQLREFIYSVDTGELEQELTKMDSLLLAREESKEGGVGEEEEEGEFEQLRKAIDFEMINGSNQENVDPNTFDFNSCFHTQFAQ